MRASLTAIQEHQNKVTSNKLFTQLLYIISKHLTLSGVAGSRAVQNFISIKSSCMLSYICNFSLVIFTLLSSISTRMQLTLTYVFTNLSNS